MIKPENYYKKHDLILKTVSEVAQKVSEIEVYANANGLKVFWRGQMDWRWGLFSSLVRQVSAVVTPSDELLNKVEERILKDSQEWIADFETAAFSQPLARLGYMQHHGIPTRLIDFTSDPWIALFFATEGMDEVDGRIFALLVKDTDIIKTTPADKPWLKYKTNEIKIWDAVSSGVRFPRLVSQKGVLALGRLPSTSPHRIAFDEVTNTERSLLAEEVRSILSIPFKLCSSSPIPAGATLPIGFTFRIHVNKESIRRDLAKKPGGPRNCANVNKIDHNLVYPDADGMRTHSPFLKGLAKKALVLS